MILFSKIGIRILKIFSVKVIIVYRGCHPPFLFHIKKGPLKGEKIDMLNLFPFGSWFYCHFENLWKEGKSEVFTGFLPTFTSYEI